MHGVAGFREPPLNPKSIRYEELTMPPVPTAPNVTPGSISSIGMTRDPREFYSNKYDDIRRSVLLRRDPERRTRYVDPFHNVLTTPSGRQLMYDDTHPETIYGSQISSELADNNNCYSFPTTSGLTRETPWCKDLQWRVSASYATFLLCLFFVCVRVDRVPMPTDSSPAQTRVTASIDQLSD